MSGEAEIRYGRIDHFNIFDAEGGVAGRRKRSRSVPPRLDEQMVWKPRTTGHKKRRRTFFCCCCLSFKRVAVLLFLSIIVAHCAFFLTSSNSYEELIQRLDEQYARSWSQFQETIKKIEKLKNSNKTKIVQPQNQNDEENGREIQQRRLRWLQNTCETETFQANTTRQSFKMLKSKNISLIYCLQAKAGTTTILSMMLQWAGVDIQGKNEAAIHKLSRRYLEQAYVGAATSSDVNSFTFMFVRHPFTRLVSAYRDKVKEGNINSIIEKTKSGFMPRLPLSHDRDAEQDEAHQLLPEELKSSQPTFREFAALVAAKINKCNNMKVPRQRSNCLKGLNTHIRPLSSRCDPCKVNYDFIGKIETSKQDLKQLMVETGFPETAVHLNHSYAEEVYFGKRKRRNSAPMFSHVMTTAEATKKYFSRMSEYEVNNVMQAYRTDFNLFEYDYKEFIDDGATE